jgi:F0F1-type ATP synthase alpha subunit
MIKEMKNLICIYQSSGQCEEEVLNNFRRLLQEQSVKVTNRISKQLP